MMEFLKRKPYVWLAAVCLHGVALPTPLASQTAPAPIGYDRQVHAILAARCLMCHSREKRSGGLSLAAYQDLLDGGRGGAAVKPGNAKASLLIRRISGETQPTMPIGGPPLAAAEVAAIRAWIDQGARATPTSPAAKPKWEAPLSLERPAAAHPVWKNWTAPVDSFAAAYLSGHGVAEPQPVSDRAFARRAYLDIWGLIPPPEDLRAFLDDNAPGKRGRLVATLLAGNRKYAEHWISFWNDLLRNDEGVNYYSETASRKSISDWLFASLQSNLPYDRFVAQLLNPKTRADPEGFLIGVNWRGAVSASQTPALQAAQNTAQIFLGINLKCNSCHDSFISHWKLREAYALAAYFSPEEKLQLHRCEVAQQQYTGAEFLYPELNRALASQSLADRRAAAAAIFTDPRNGRLARTLVNRIWQRLLGRGIVENPDEMDGEPWSPELLDALSSDFVEHGYDLKHLIATIVSSRTYQMAAVARTGEQPRQYVFRGPEIRRLTAEQFADAIGSITGEWRVVNSEYSREWRTPATLLTRALGRPIRDQVYSTRETQATTLQALELVNGQTLTHWLLRGARHMLNELPPEPVSLFDKTVNGRGPPARFEVNISGASRLWLLVEDMGSYSPEKVGALWADVELAGPAGVTRLSTLKPVDGSGLRDGAGAASDGVRAKTPSRLVYDISGRGFATLRGGVVLENREITSDINPHIRFFVFRDEPDMERLTAVAPGTPLPAGPPLKTASEVAGRVFWYALGRAPTPEERTVSESALADPDRPGKVSAEGLADLLWAVLTKPEFQLIY
jgi:hypothetical protein